MLFAFGNQCRSKESPQAGRQNEKLVKKIISYDDAGKNTGHKNRPEFGHDANLTSTQQTNGKQQKRTKRQKLRCGPTFFECPRVRVCLLGLSLRGCSSARMVRGRGAFPRACSRCRLPRRVGCRLLNPWRGACAVCGIVGLGLGSADGWPCWALWGCGAK